VIWISCLSHRRCEPAGKRLPASPSAAAARGAAPVAGLTAVSVPIGWSCQEDGAVRPLADDMFGNDGSPVVLDNLVVSVRTCALKSRWVRRT
jgi:hypothetical protein